VVVDTSKAWRISLCTSPLQLYIPLALFSFNYERDRQKGIQIRAISFSFFIIFSGKH
jgi:hypothetical protein